MNAISAVTDFQTRHNIFSLVRVEILHFLSTLGETLSEANHGSWSQGRLIMSCDQIFSNTLLECSLASWSRNESKKLVTLFHCPGVYI